MGASVHQQEAVRIDFGRISLAGDAVMSRSRIGIPGYDRLETLTQIVRAFTAELLKFLSYQIFIELA